MGVINKGSISGVLPSNSDGFAVHYPGYPSSVDRAIVTLGCSDGVLKLPADSSKRLELRFRPEDPYSHPVYGDLHSCTNFLLKISKKKSGNVQNSSENRQTELPSLRESAVSGSTETINSAIVHEPEDQKRDKSSEQLEAEIVSRVSEAYHFDGMADYQHVLPLHADAIRRKKRNWMEVEALNESGDLLDIDQEDIMMLVPPLFSVKDRPEKVVLKPCGDTSLKKKPEDVAEKKPEDVAEHMEEESSSIAKKISIEPCLAIDFNIKEIPRQVSWEEFIPNDCERWQWQKAVCELFAERPIWPKSSLAERLLDQGFNIANNVLRRLLFVAAYYFSNGPYLRFWIRKGYDPRKDQDSRIYQRTDFRVPPSLRSYCFADAASVLNDRWEDICAFRVFPRKCQTSLQLFELQDDYIQQEIRKPATQETCSLQTGWFSSQVVDTMRLRVAQRYLSVYPGAGAESLLKHVTSRFEKSRRAFLNVKNPKAERPQKKARATETAAVANEDKEKNDEVEDKDDEEDYDDDLVVEDADEDEEFDLVDQDGDPFSYPCIHSDMEQENVAKDYLQDLFGSFPFGATGQDDPNDEEYPIYERPSDDDDDDRDY